MILIMPDHGETVELPDDSDFQIVRMACDRLFSKSHCETVTVATRTHSNSESCDAQFVIHRDKRPAGVLDDLKRRVLEHVPYDDPMSDANAIPVLTDRHPTLAVDLVEIYEAYPYHQACALEALLHGDFQRAKRHIDRAITLAAAAPRC